MTVWPLLFKFQTYFPGRLGLNGCLSPGHCCLLLEGGAISLSLVSMLLSFLSPFLPESLCCVKAAGVWSGHCVSFKL